MRGQIKSGHKMSYLQMCNDVLQAKKLHVNRFWCQSTRAVHSLTIVEMIELFILVNASVVEYGGLTLIISLAMEQVYTLCAICDSCGKLVNTTCKTDGINFISCVSCTYSLQIVSSQAFILVHMSFLTFY